MPRRKLPMPQSSSGSTTKTSRITLVKDGDEFRVFEISGGTVNSDPDGPQTLDVELPKEMINLRFTTTDVQVGPHRYVVEASIVVGGESAVWATVSGEHLSPLVERDPTKEGVTEVYTKSMTLAFVIKGPVVAGSSPAEVGQVKPPTTVVIRSRLDWP
jgi:hypothetical protein